MRAINHASSRRDTRQGFTLFEILLVLTLMIAIAALVVPTLHRSIKNYRMRKSADIVRSEWAKARNRAIRNGQIYVFRYSPQASQYRVDVAVSEFSAQAASAGAVGGGIQFQETAGQTGLPAAGIQMGSTDFHSLPDGIMFASGVTALDSRAVSVEQNAGLPTSIGVTGELRVYFYPDGTTSTARVTLTNQERFVVIDLRGLTGIAQVSEILSAEDLVQ